MLIIRRISDGSMPVDKIAIEQVQEILKNKVSGPAGRGNRPDSGTFNESPEIPLSIHPPGG